MTDTAIAVSVDESVIRTDERLVALEKAVSDMRDKLNEILTSIDQIKDAVEPTIASLSNSTIGKMLGL